MKTFTNILLLCSTTILLGLNSCRKDEKIMAIDNTLDTLKTGYAKVYRESDLFSSFIEFHHICKVSDNLYTLYNYDSCFIIDTITMQRGSKNVYFSRYRFANTAYCKQGTDSAFHWALEMQIWNGRWIAPDSLVAEIKSSIGFTNPPTPYTGRMYIKIY